MGQLLVRPIDNSPFGAEVLGLDPANISDADREVIWEAYRTHHGLLCFSVDRMLVAQELHALTAIFGDNEFAPGRINGFGKKAEDGREALSVEAQVKAIRDRGDDPYMAYIGNVNPKTLAANTNIDDKFFGEWEWHTDMSYIEVPPTFSLLHARDIPDDGADTGFCNQVLAAVEMPEPLRRSILGLELKHDSTYGSSGIIRPGMSPPKSPVEALGYAHPILRIVPSTGEEALFLGRRTNGYIPGLPLDESEALLNALWQHATQPQFCYRHQWQEGQTVVWDNRMMLHMRYPMDNRKTRFMWRTQTKGEAVLAVQ